MTPRPRDCGPRYRDLTEPIRAEDGAVASVGDGRPEIRIVLATAELLLQGALAALLAPVRDIRVMTLASRASDLAAQVQCMHPAVAVVDIGLPDLANLAGLANLRERYPTTRILALVFVSRSIDVASAVQADVDGVLRTTVTPDVFVRAIRRVSRGEPVIDYDLAAAALRGRCPLSRREIAVLAMVSEGMPLPDIAAHLHLSGGTVRNQVSTILAKSGARNRVDAIRIAYQEGWLDIPTSVTRC
jgi:two-component system response regulator DesR